MNPRFDKEKYLKIARGEGVSAALTTLHRDIELWEYETFEGEKGFQPEIFEHLKEVRTFSRELWDLHLNDPKIKP